MKAYAYVNHGRWVANCGTPFCPEAHAVAPGDRFDCSNCGESFRVSWPLCKPQIERVLERRPVPQTRNWLVGESVSDLKHENQRFGVDI